MKKILLMLAVAATLLMGSSVFAHNAGHGSGHGWNNGHGHSHHKPVRRPRNHCHKKRIRVRGGHHRGGHRGHGFKRHYFKWVSYCHHHRKSRRGHHNH